MTSNFREGLEKKCPRVLGPPLDLVVSFPRLLLATNRYSPLSVLFTFVIVSCLLSAEKLILELLLIGNPPLIHDIVDAGFPVALPLKVTFSPSVFVIF